VACNGAVFATVPRYDRLGPCMSLHYLFGEVLALSVMFGHIKINVPDERESGQKLSVIIQYQAL